MPFPNSLCTDGIAGESEIQGRQECSDVYEFRHEFESPHEPLTGSAAGTRKHGLVFVTIKTEKSIPVYARALCLNEVLATVRLDFYRINPESRGQEIFYTITLRNARVDSMRVHVPKSDDPTKEEFTPIWTIGFAYHQIEWHHHPHNLVEIDEWHPPGEDE